MQAVIAKAYIFGNLASAPLKEPSAMDALRIEPLSIARQPRAFQAGMHFWASAVIRLHEINMPRQF